jgi:hypothetical protein
MCYDAATDKYVPIALHARCGATKTAGVMRLSATADSFSHLF